MSACRFPKGSVVNYETSISFDKLPEAVTYLTALVTSLLGELRELRNALSPPKKSRLILYPLKRRAHCLESVRTLFIKRRETALSRLTRVPAAKAGALSEASC